MQIETTKFNGVVIASAEPAVDHRGSFTRLWCRDSLAADESYAASQMSLATTTARGTIRGLHYQSGTHWESKYIRCLRGEAIISAVDLRSESATYLQHLQFPIAANDNTGLFLPAGFVQGYQTLADATEILYLMSLPYCPEASCGYRFDDPAFGIKWPLPPVNLSERDLSWPAFNHG